MRMIKGMSANAQGSKTGTCRMGPFSSVGRRTGGERGEPVSPHAHCVQAVPGTRRGDGANEVTFQLWPGDSER